MKILQQKSGFTLIEMMVAVAIMIAMTGVGVAGFIRFNDRQEVSNAAKQIQHIMRSAQSKARVKELPGGCTNLFSYEVYRSGNGPINVRANCQSGTNVQLSSWTTPTNLSITPSSFSVKFRTLHGSAGISGGTSLIINVIKSSEHDYEFVVNNGGEITTGGFRP